MEKHDMKLLGICIFFSLFLVIGFMALVGYQTDIHREHEHIRQLLVQEEGYRTKPYYDTKGLITIGIGHNLSENGLPPALIEELYEYDIQKCIRDVRKNAPIYDKLSFPRKAVLVDIRFNAGLGGLLKFTELFKSLESGDYDAAAQAILDSEIAPQRREALAKIMKEDYI